MSRPKTFLLCQDELHAETVDQFIAEHLREVDGTICSCWSGVYTDGTRFGVLWAAPGSSVFGQPVSEDNPDGDPALTFATEQFNENGESDWRLLEPEPAVEEMLP